MSDEKIMEQTETHTQTPSSFTEHYEQVRLLVESLEQDVLKSQNGNKSAQVRVRKTLRLLKTKAGDFVKFSLGK